MLKIMLGHKNLNFFIKRSSAQLQMPDLMLKYENWRDFCLPIGALGIVCSQVQKLCSGIPNLVLEI